MRTRAKTYAQRLAVADSEKDSQNTSHQSLLLEHGHELSRSPSPPALLTWLQASRDIPVSSIANKKTLVTRFPLSSHALQSISSASQTSLNDQIIPIERNQVSQDTDSSETLSSLSTACNSPPVNAILSSENNESTSDTDIAEWELSDHENDIPESGELELLTTERSNEATTHFTRNAAENHHSISEDSDLVRLSVRVKSILQNGSLEAVISQPPSQRTSSVYLPLASTKAIAKAVQDGTSDPAKIISDSVKTALGGFGAHATNSTMTMSATANSMDSRLSEQENLTPKTNGLSDTQESAPLSASSDATEIDSKVNGDGDEQKSTPASSSNSAVMDVEQILPGFTTRADARKIQNSFRPNPEMKQFEDESTRRRMDSRMGHEDDGGDERAHKSDLGIEGDNTGINTTDSLIASAGGSVATDQMSEPMEATRSELEPSQECLNINELANGIIEAVNKSNKKIFSKGDMALIVDVDDLSKTVILSSAFFSERVSSFFEQSAVAADGLTNDVTTWQGKLRYIFLLEANGNTHNTPLFKQLQLGTTLEVLKQLPYKPFLRTVEATKEVKQEGQDPDEGMATEQTIPPNDWIKAYEVFLSILPGSEVSSNRILKMLAGDATSALPQLEGVIAIAEQYNALDIIKENSSLRLIVPKYMGNTTLFSAIAAEAASWLFVGRAIEDEIIFREAFSHVAGRMPAWPWSKPKTAMPQDVTALLESSYAAWTQQFWKTYIKLSIITVKASNDAASLPVSQRNNALKYDIVNFFRDWVVEHFQLVDPERSAEQTITPQPSWCCDHKDQQCLTIGKLLRTIRKGGDAYLTPEQVLGKWNRKRYHINHEGEMRETLKILKDEASRIVAPMVDACSLYYDQKDQLDYLPCVAVKEADLPWSIDGEDDEIDV